MPRHAIDYSKTIIYKIVCNDLNITETYVGHTTNFVKRKYEHKRVCNIETDKHFNLKVYKTIRENGGWDNWSILEICKYSCNSFHEAALEERRHYELLNANLNIYNPCRTYQEYKETNKDIFLQRNKKSYEKNRETYLEKNKIRYKKNKDIVLEKQKKYYDKNREIRLEKNKIWYKKNKDIVLEYQKIYAEKNRDKILEYQKIYREKNKEKYTCCCGSNIRKLDKATHNKSVKHQKFISSSEVTSLDVSI
jgi:hypothetical protein